LEDLGIDGKLILEWILVTSGGTIGHGCMWLRTVPVVGSCEHGNEYSCSIKDGEFVDLLSDY
jgi:hypothetical protein